MTPRSSNPTPNQDDQLADFADRVRDSKPVHTDSIPDDELRGLEDMILRLDHAFPKEPMNEEVAKRMQADFSIRKRRQEAQEQAGRQTWLSALFQSPVALAVATFVVVGALMLLTPTITSGGDSVSGAAGSQAQSIGILVIVLGLAILLVFFSRHKK